MNQRRMKIREQYSAKSGCAMSTNTTTIDLTLDDVIPTSEVPNIIFIPVNHPNFNIIPQTKPIKESKRNDFLKDKKRDPNQTLLSKAQLEFIDHVVMIWLNRARRGDRKIIMPSSVIKAKGKEAATILNKFAKFSPTDWMHNFEVKMEREDAQGPRRYTKDYPSLNVADIVQKEWSHFFVDMEVDVKKEYAIQTYHEAFECLKLVEAYAKSVHNLKAIKLMIQIEELLREGEDQ